MLRLAFAGAAALGVGLVGGWTWIVLTPAAVPQIASFIKPDAAIAPALADEPATVATAERTEPPASEPEASVVVREGSATETAAQAKVVSEQPKAQPPVSAPARSKAPPLILGVRH
jgi:hypothetical protein